MRAPWNSEIDRSRLPGGGRRGRNPASPILFRQSTGKLLRILPLAAIMAAGSSAILLLGLRGGGLQALAPGVLGVAFFGPAFVILLWAFIRPNYLAVDDEGVRFRTYCVEGRIPWEEIRRVSAGAGWPSLTFHDCERVSRQVRLCDVRPLGWVLEIPTRAVSLMIRRRLANIYPAAWASWRAASARTRRCSASTTGCRRACSRGRRRRWCERRGRSGAPGGT